MTLMQSQLATAYAVDPATICRLAKTAGLEVIANPHRLFDHLLRNSRASELRTRLSNPNERDRIATEINISTVRGNIPTACEKIQSIQ